MTTFKYISGLLFGLFLISSNLQAQNFERVQFRLSTQSGLAWANTPNERIIVNNGVGYTFNFGLQLDFKLAKYVGFTMGIFYGWERLKTQNVDTAYYNFDGFNLVETGEGVIRNKQLLARKWDSQGFEVPLGIRLRTKEMGIFTYYGKIGVLNRFNIRNSSHDTQRDLLTNQEEEIEKIDLKKASLFYQFGLFVGGGMEYNLSGNTSLFWGIQYNHNLVSTAKKNNPYATRVDGTQYQQQFFKGAILLNLGVLF